MQFNVVLRTGGLAINMEKFEEKEGNNGIILTEIGVGMSSLAGGLVLDKKQTPHQLVEITSDSERKRSPQRRRTS